MWVRSCVVHDEHHRKSHLKHDLEKLSTKENDWQAHQDQSPGDENCVKVLGPASVLGIDSHGQETIFLLESFKVQPFPVKIDDEEADHWEQHQERRN